MQEDEIPSGPFSSNLVSLDSFARAFRFGLPAGKQYYQSKKGCCLTFILVLVILFYSTMQMLKLIQFRDTDVMVS